MIINMNINIYLNKSKLLIKQPHACTRRESKTQRGICNVGVYAHLIGQAIIEYGRTRAATTFVVVNANGAGFGAGR
ncbi:hypothetical protein [Orgyia pseudotsugata single capsid nuclopolyhedrovirus]|nr:hypothetical protein [Orgyia pseudotsugata single capsid nuclopolyhedrovirus]